MSKNRKQSSRSRKSSTQEASAASGGIVGVRRSLRAAGKGDRTLKIVIWASVVLVALALLFVILVP